jgi:hypothetical protein
MLFQGTLTPLSVGNLCDICIPVAQIMEVFTMATAPTATREAPAATPRAVSARPTPSASEALRAAESRAAEASRQLRARPARPLRTPTDDEILGLDSASLNSSPVGARQEASPGGRLVEPEGADALGADPWRESDQLPDARADGAPDPTVPTDPAAEPESIRAVLEANPDLRRAWDDAQAYRETFSSPEEARTASALLADLDRMDALFFSRRPEDHAELARAVASLDPAAFASLAGAMHAHAATQPPVIPKSEATRNLTSDVTAEIPRRPQGGLARDDNTSGAPPTQAQTEFFHAANAAAVHSVLESIESQVERLLPEGISKSARNRVVGEIYRELDTTLRSNRQLAQQMREAFRSGALDTDHQRALVSLVTGRARQALPGVAKRVLNEWTSTIVAANQDRRTRQRVAEHRVDIAGSGGAGSDGQRAMTPRDIDYRRMSDSDILNL